MSFVSNSPVEQHGPKTLSDGMDVYTLPLSVYDAFTAVYSLPDLFDFTKLRDVLSLEDIARLRILSQKLSEKLTATGENWRLSSILDNYKGQAVQRTQQNVNEIEGSINLLVQTPALRDEVDGFLFPKEERSGCGEALCSSDTEPKEQKPYRVVILSDAIYILVEEGFGTYLEKSPNKLDFLTRVLKSAYAIYPVRMVNSSLWYPLYLRALAA